MSRLLSVLNSQKIRSGLRKGADRVRYGIADKVRHNIEDSIRLSKSSQIDSPVVNQKEIRVVGLRRTGNHAIMNWIRKQQTGGIFYINNAPINVNPFRHVYEDQLRKAKNPSIGGWRTQNIERWHTEAAGEFTTKDCLVYSYEDQPLGKLRDPNFEKKHDIYFGKSKIRYDLIILRDPFNLFASRLRASRRNNNGENYIDFMKVKSRASSLAQLWTEYAQEYLNETQYLQHIKVPVNYNQWVSDTDYRRQLAEALELEFTDSGVDEVMTNGGGSSFEGTELQGKASEMAVLERWKNFRNDPEFRALLQSDTLYSYSEKIFGALPETDDLRP